MFKRHIALLLCFALVFSNLQYAQAQSTPSSADFNINQLPVPGTMISLSPAYVPVIAKGLHVHPENPTQWLKEWLIEIEKEITIQDF